MCLPRAPPARPSAPAAHHHQPCRIEAIVIECCRNLGLHHHRVLPTTPGSWNDQYGDIYNYLDLAWYVKRTYVPRSWQGQRVYLRVGSANYQATVYVNGTQVGSHEGGHLPFAFEITH
ncbi:MAG: hypothetical protein JO352_24515, partial [Chloroflexi bacterium]|nr:hypothetical protein [Chloroflexota bacterium]